MLKRLTLDQGHSDMGMCPPGCQLTILVVEGQIRSDSPFGIFSRAYPHLFTAKTHIFSVRCIFLGFFCHTLKIQPKPWLKQESRNCCQT